MSSIRHLYTRTFPEQGCECIIGGSVDSYFFPLSPHVYIRLEVTDTTIQAHIFTNRRAELLLTSPEFTGILDIPAFVRQLPFDPLYVLREPHIESDEDLALWLKTYADEYSFAAFKKSALDYVNCFYAFSYEEPHEDAGIATFNSSGDNAQHIDNMEVEHGCIDVHSEAGGVTLTFGSGRKNFNRSLLVDMEDECDLVQPYVQEDAKLQSYLRRKRLTQIIDSF